MDDRQLSPIVNDDPIGLVISIWLNAKYQHSKSDGTRNLYERTIFQFRLLLQQMGRDLNPGNDEQYFQEITLAAQGFAQMSVRVSEVAGSTYNLRLDILSSFYRFVIKRKFFKCANPIELIERAAIQQYAESSALDADFVATKFAAIDRTQPKGLRDYALLSIFFQTGRRLSEVTTLRWKHVAIRGSVIVLTFERCKGGKRMTDELPLTVSTSLLAWMIEVHGKDLRNLPPETPLWISFTRKSMVGYLPGLTPRSVENIFYARLGLDAHSHVGRHTFSHNMEEIGAKVSDIQARLGHSSLAQTGRYLASLRRAKNTHGDELALRFGI